MASAKEIALLERKLKSAKTNREKIVLAKELKDLKSKLSTTQKKETLPTQRRKIRMLSSAEFNELIARLKQKPEYSFLKSMGKKKIEDDYRVVGKPVGWRIKGKNNYRVPSKRFRAENPDLVYYENRINRSDVRRPNRLEQGGMMAKGGYVSKGEMVWKKLTDSQKMDFLYKNFTPEITPRSQEKLVGKSWNFLPKNVKIKFESKYANVEDYATGGKVWKVSDTSKAKYVGIIEFQDNDGEYHNFEVMDNGDRLVFGGMTNSGFIESGYIEKDGFSTDEALQELYADLETYYNDGAEYTSMIVVNQRMATGGSLKKKDVKHPKAFKIDLDVESRMGNNEHFEVGKMKGYGDALVSRGALQHNAPDNYKYSVKATNKYARGGGVKKKVKTQPAPIPNANVKPMDSYNIELVQSQGKDDKGTYFMFPKPADKNSKGVLFEQGGEIEENAKFYADNPNWTNEKLLAEYEKLNVDLRNFNNGFLKPKQVIGGGYKSSAIAKKLAKQWLENKIAEYKMALEIRGVMAKGGMTKKEFQAKKIGKVMHEFKQGDLHSGRSGKIVKNREQAIAIGLSEAKRGWKNRNK